MAKPWAQSFYKGKAWRMARAQALKRDQYTCCRCGDRATEVHHIVELTPENIHDIRIALGLDNLESLCWLCHNKETKGSNDIADGYYFDEAGQPRRIHEERK